MHALNPAANPPGRYMCNQGLNEQGLAVGLQAQDTDFAFVPAFDASNKDKPRSLNWWDMSNTFLAK